MTEQPRNPLMGVFLATMGTMVSALGNHLIVKGHARKNDPRSSTLYLAAGNVCVVLLGTSLGLAALAYAPQSLLSPLGGLTVVWNLLLATLPFFGGVRPRAEEFFYTLMTLLGMGVVVFMGPKSRGEKSSFQMLARPIFISLVAVYTAVIAYLTSGKLESKSLRRIAAGATGAMVGGLSNVFAKSAVDFYSGNQVASEVSDYGTFGMILVLAIGLAIAQLMMLNSALATYSAVQVVPIYQTTLCIAATVSGGVAFDEFRDLGAFQSVMFVCGVLVSAMGVLLSALRSAPASEVEKD